jgi:chemotaxis signal transduction protein
MLLAQLESGERIALTTSGLKRIEKLVGPCRQKLQDQELITYQDAIIPVIDVVRLLRHRDASTGEGETASRDLSVSDPTHVAIYETDGNAVGLIIGPVVDIAQHILPVRGKPTRKFIAFTAMIDDQLIEFLDLDSIVATAEFNLNASPISAIQGA